MVSKSFCIFYCFTIFEFVCVWMLMNCIALMQLLFFEPWLGIHFSRALFVPNMSKYSKVVSGASVISSDLHGIDLSWQFNLQRIWEKITHGKGMLCLFSLWHVCCLLGLHSDVGHIVFLTASRGNNTQISMFRMKWNFIGKY